MDLGILDMIKGVTKPETLDDVSIVEALLHLGIKSADVNGELTLLEGAEMPSDEVVASARQEVFDLYQEYFYQKQRGAKYPKLVEQLDMLWHAIDQGKLDKTSDFYQAIKTVKDEFPKS
jgi:4-hydroxyphenylpyruvate dioxygenase-like putative hemolysin